MRPIAAILLTLLLSVSVVTAAPPTFRGRTIGQWSDDLSHPNSVVRVEAAKMLGRLGPHAGDAVDPLITALRDRNPDVRLYVATALGRITHQPDKCIAALTKVLADNDDHVCFAAEWSLARIAEAVVSQRPSPQEAETLASLLATAEASLVKRSARNLKHVRQIAAARQALTTTTEQVGVTNHADAHVGAGPLDRQPLTDPVRGLIADLNADDKLTQLKAITALGQMKRTVDLIDAWRTFRDDGWLSWFVTQTVVKIGEPAVPELSLALRDAEESIGLQAADCLARMGPIALPSLASLLDVVEDQQVSADLRSAAIATVERFGPSANSSVAPLTRLLKSGEPEFLVEKTMRALAAIGPTAGAAESTLLDILQDENQPDSLRRAAAETLPAVSPSSAEVLETLVAMLRQQDDPYFTASLATSLGKYGEAAAPAVPRLVELVDTTVDFERQGIIRALGNIGPLAGEAAPRLIECMTDVEEFESVQVTAAIALGQLGEDAIVALGQQLEHPNPLVRQAVVRALIEIGEQAEAVVKPLELRLVDRDEDPQVRSLAAVALGQIGPEASRALPALTRLFGDTRQVPYLRAMAAVSIGQIDAAHSPILIAGLNDDEPQIRVAAAYALQLLPTPHPDALPVLVRELENEAARGMAMRALSDFNTESRALLTEVVENQAKGEDLRITCLTLISDNGVDAAEQLLEALNDETLADTAYWSLRDLGNNSIPFLVSAADNEDAFTPETRGAIRDLIDEMSDGIGGGGEGDSAWTGGHALVQGFHDAFHPAARMATAAPMMMEAAAPEEIMPPKPELATARSNEDRESIDDTLTPPPIAPETGFKSVRVFYGTNRNKTGVTDQQETGSLPWYAWVLVVVIFAAMLVFVIKQIRRRDVGRTIVGGAGIILFSLAVEAATTHFQQHAHELARSGPVYGTEYSTQVKLGVCDVTIPDVHQEGQVERPSIMRLQVVEDPEKHIVLKRVQQLEPDAFYSDLHEELGRRGSSVLVFVHGYNVSFESAARRTAQMSHDLKFAGAPIFYSWPSQANWRKYRIDEKNVELSITQLKGFLLDIARRSRADTINLIAHSMGNRALTNALKEMEVVTSEQDKLFNQVILAAPDIDADIFRERIAPAIVSKARHITLYASSKDLALVASREFNNGDPRAGDAGADLVIVPGIDTIDVSAGVSSLLGHTYYGDSTSVLHDIEYLLRDRPAAERDFLQPYPRPEPKYWLFQPAVIARRNDATEPLR